MKHTHEKVEYQNVKQIFKNLENEMIYLLKFGVQSQ
jgi:hypothetical protein